MPPLTPTCVVLAMRMSCALGMGRYLAILVLEAEDYFGVTGVDPLDMRACDPSLIRHARTHSLRLRQEPEANENDSARLTYSHPIVSLNLPCTYDAYSRVHSTSLGTLHVQTLLQYCVAASCTLELRHMRT